MGEMKRIRWGIWGAGSISHQLAGDFPLVQGAALHAVASRSEERARQFAARHGVTRFYTSLDALLNDPDVDAVYVATPNHLHMQDSVACLAAGKAVLCEKPFALNLHQARKIVAAAGSARTFCMEAMWTRFIPAVIHAKRAIDSGMIGPIRLMQGDFAYPAPASSRAFTKQEGGGALLDRGVYLVSLAQHLLGRARSAHALSSIGPSGVDEQSSYQLQYSNGALANFTASLCTRGANEFIVSGERGVVRFCDPFYRAHRIVTQSFAQPAEGNGGGIRHSPVAQLMKRRLSGLLGALTSARGQLFAFPGNGYHFELQHASDCLRQGLLESPIMPLDDSLEVMRVLDLLQAQIARQESAMLEPARSR
jgi:predicted dehydrogenase